MALKTSFRGLWMAICDTCGRKFEIDGSRDLTPCKQNTVRLARYYGWRIGKRGVFCAKCKLAENADAGELAGVPASWLAETIAMIEAEQED